MRWRLPRACGSEKRGEPAPAHAGILACAKMSAFADSYEATVLRNEKRLNNIETEMSNWQRQPMDTLLRQARLMLSLRSTDS